MNVNMIGFGYIGFFIVVVMVGCGLNVIGVDINQVVCDIINQGKIYIVEFGLEVLVFEVVVLGYFKVVIVFIEVDVFVIVVFIFFKDNYVLDFFYIKLVCNGIVLVLKKGDLVILEFIFLVGMIDKMVDWLCEVCQDLVFFMFGEIGDVDVYFVYCLECVLLGQVIEELVSNDCVIGGMIMLCLEKV